jgi:hypothetical protein
MYYIKEHGWYYEKIYSTHETLAEAQAMQPKDIGLNGRGEGQVRYVIEHSSGDKIQLLNE